LFLPSPNEEQLSPGEQEEEGSPNLIDPSHLWLSYSQHPNLKSIISLIFSTKEFSNYFSSFFG